jgi:hypothetical protein
VVDEAAVTDAIAGTRAVEEVRGIAHAFHAAGDGDVRTACKQKIVRQHDGLHTGAAHFVDGDCAGGGWQARAESSLTRGSLAEAGCKNAAEEDFVDCVGRDSGAGNSRAFEGGANGGSAELRSGEILEVALKCADGRAGGADNDDGIGGLGHSRSGNRHRPYGTPGASCSSPHAEARG